MKHASILLLTLGLCGLSFAACAEGDDSTFGNKPSGGTGGDGGKGTGNGSSASSASSSGNSSSSSSNGNPNPGTCSLKCAADTECQTGCNMGKPPPVGIYCCDTGTGTCYVSGAMTCPSQGAGSSGGMYP